MAASKRTTASIVINPAQELYYNVTNNDNQHGLIILGNSGVGKSFLANILLGSEAFVHEFSSGSVTHITEYQEIDLLYDSFAIFNTPGLIEAEQERIDSNKKEIDKAFAQRPNSIVMFVFGQQGGRIREEDIVAFNAINAAYPFKPESLVLVVNSLPQKRPPKYEGTTLVLLQQLLTGVLVSNRNLCFLEQINEEDTDERQRLKEQLLQMIVEFRPSIHRKKQEIVTLIDELKQGKKIIKEQQAHFEADREKYMKQIEDSQHLFNETITKHCTEIESMQRAIQLYEEQFAEQQRRFEDENRRYQTQLQDLHEQVKESQCNYEKLRGDHEVSQQQMLDAQEAYRELQNAYEKLANQPKPSPPRKSRWYETTLDFLTKAIPVINLIPWSKFTSSLKK